MHKAVELDSKDDRVKFMAAPWRPKRLFRAKRENFFSAWKTIFRKIEINFFKKIPTHVSKHLPFSGDYSPLPRQFGAGFNG